jgi:acetyl esterase/lipase
MTGAQPEKTPPAPTLAYGSHPDQVANLHLPSGDGPFPVVVLIHGGFWHTGWDRTLMTPLARDLAGRGVAAWNMEYRRVGQEGGGWPGTFEDVAAAFERLLTLNTLDVSRVIACGHSAGGHLALWFAGRWRSPASVGGASLRPKAAIGLAPVTDLRRANREGLGNGAVAKLLGGDADDVSERYAATDPAALVPFGIPQLLVHGARDEAVPIVYSRSYVRTACEEAMLLEFPDADHFDIIEPAHETWKAVIDQLPRLLHGRPTATAQMAPSQAKERPR